MKVEIVNFNVVYPIWKNKLWKNRRSKITPSSPVDYLGEYNYELMKNYPIFFACYEKGQVVGVNSLLETSELYCRSRGLYVEKEQRLKGVGKALLEKTLEFADTLSYKYIWSMPRKTALQVYLKCGFVQTSDFDDQYEFGPNCFVLKRIGD